MLLSHFALKNVDVDFTSSNVSYYVIGTFNFLLHVFKLLGSVYPSSINYFTRGQKLIHLVSKVRMKFLTRDDKTVGRRISFVCSLTSSNCRQRPTELIVLLVATA